MTNTPIGFTVIAPNLYPSPDVTIIKGQYIDLVRIQESHQESHQENHIDALYNCFVNINENSWTYLWHGPFKDKLEFTKFIHEFCFSDDPYFFCVKDKTSDEILGMLSLMRIDINHGVMEVGHIHFGQKLKGTTQATEAIFLIMKYAFDLGYRRFEWKCDVLNAPSKKSALRFGFVYEGTFKQHMIYKGRNRDTAWFSIIDTQWDTLNSKYVRWLSPDNFDSHGKQQSKLND